MSRSLSDKHSEHAPNNPERIRKNQTRYRMALTGYGYDDSEERRAFLKLMEGKEYGEGPLMSAWAWFREGYAGVSHEAPPTFPCTAVPRCTEKRLCVGFASCPSHPATPSSIAPLAPHHPDAEVRRMFKAWLDEPASGPTSWEDCYLAGFRKANEFEFALSAIAPTVNPLQEHYDKLAAEVSRLQDLINSPEIDLFLRAVHLEAVHQVERWGTTDDRAKRPADWFWLIGYLGGKALHSQVADNTEKALHHCISTAAALYNWHCAIKGTDVRMCPGSSDVERIVEAAFPSVTSDGSTDSPDGFDCQKPGACANPACSCPVIAHKGATVSRP